MSNLYDQDLAELLSTTASGEGGMLGRSNNPKEDDEDTLFGRGVANSIAVVGEGQLEGFPTQTIWNGKLVNIDQRNCLYLNNQVLRYPGQNKNNVKRVRLKFRSGTGTQKQIQGFTNTIANDTSVGVIVKKTSGEVVRSFVNNQVDMIRVNLAVRMIKQDKNITGTELVFEIYTQRNSDGWKRRKRVTLQEKSTDYSPLSYDIPVNNQNGSAANWGVKVVKITADGDGSKVINDLQWLSYGQIIETKLQYRHTAIIATQLDSETFSSFPDQTVDMHGTVGLLIPAGCAIRADRTLDYTGVNWTGATQITTVAVNDIFAVVVNELTNPRINRFPLRLDQIDLSDLFLISKWNAALITHADGKQRPRYNLTFYLADERSGFDLLSELCSSCFASYYWADGKLRFWQNRSGLPQTQQFDNASAIGGVFDYPETPTDTRYNVCRVAWWNPDTAEEDEEYYEDSADVGINGYKETRVNAVGCENRYQAWLYAKAVVKQSLLEYKYCNFTAPARGIFCRPGQILTIYDENNAQVRNAGLLKAISGSTFTLDAPALASPGDTFRYIDINGTVQSLTIASSNLGAATITTTTAPSVAPLLEAAWTVSGTIVGGQYRVESVAPDASDPDNVQITTINNVPNLWDVIENNADPVILKVRGVAPPDVFPVNNLSASLLEVDVSGYDLNPDLYTLWSDWTEPLIEGRVNPYVQKYFAEFRVLPDGEWIQRQEIAKETTEVRWAGLQLGRYQSRVTAIDIYGRLGGWVLSPEVLSATTGIVDSSAIVVSGSPSNFNYPNKVLLVLKVQNLENISLKILNTGATAITELAIAFSSHSSQSRLLSSGLIDSISANYYSSGTSAGTRLTGVNNAVTANNFGMPILYATNSPGNIAPGAWSHLNLNTIGWESIYIMARTTAGTTTAKVIHSGKPVSFKYW
jgi:predicted phage tail protein